MAPWLFFVAGGASIAEFNMTVQVLSMYFADTARTEFGGRRKSCRPLLAIGARG
jgi:hypothetical protein